MGAWRLTLQDVAGRPCRNVPVVAVKNRLSKLGREVTL